MAGYEHESNGMGGAGSRGIDFVFVTPIWDFGDVNSYHLTVAPKAYWYEHIANENANIRDYRGYVDLLVKYGSPDGWQLAATFRKGIKSHYGSVDTQLTYPLSKIFSSASGAYLWIGYFNGYGEDILDYNQHRWVARMGVAVSRQALAVQGAGSRRITLDNKRAPWHGCDPHHRRCCVAACGVNTYRLPGARGMPAVFVTDATSD